MSMINKVIGILLGATLVMVLFVLPAEYGIDPTGVGGKLGLLELSEGPESNVVEEVEVKVIKGSYPSIPEEFDSWYPDTLGEPFSKTHNNVFSSEQIIVDLQSGEQVEYKAVMQQGDVIIYTWSIDKGIVYTDFHADPSENTEQYPDEYFIRYRESETASSSGSMVAPFSGNHGWYWLNIEEHPIQITLDVAGFYSEIKELGRSFQ